MEREISFNHSCHDAVCDCGRLPISQTVLANGDVELVFTGRNLVIGFDPIAGFVITVGRFGLAFDEDFNVTQPLSGNGQLIDVCRLLD